jgi:hypothetical protein
MSGGSPFDGSSVRVFRRGYAGRVSGPLGCLAAVLLCPVGIVAGVVMIVLSLLPSRRRRRAAAFRAASPGGDAREQALRRLVQAMALDDTFTADEARQAGTLAAGGATVDDLVADAIERRWIEVRGERLAVTRRGREETSGSGD